jgi:cytochrome b6-f complex iron-sulfur subunit
MDQSVPLAADASLSRRQLLNFLTGATVATALTASLYPVGQFLVPPAEDTGADGSVVARDRFGTPIPASRILQEPPGTRALVAGLAGEPTYLVVTADRTLDTMGIVNNCTHLGCTFPWNPLDQQFQCPCHGSLYAPDGTVMRGPAPLPLKLVHVAVANDLILISPWRETDPRTGMKPWWV